MKTLCAGWSSLRAAVRVVKCALDPILKNSKSSFNSKTLLSVVFVYYFTIVFRLRGRDATLGDSLVNFGSLYCLDFRINLVAMKSFTWNFKRMEF